MDSMRHRNDVNVNTNQDRSERGNTAQAHRQLQEQTSKRQQTELDGSTLESQRSDDIEGNCTCNRSGVDVRSTGCRSAIEGKAKGQGNDLDVQPK